MDIRMRSKIQKSKKGINRDAAEALNRDYNKEAKAFHDFHKTPDPSDPKIVNRKAYGIKGGSPFESYNPRGASVNDDFTSLVSSILGAGLSSTGVPPLIVGGFFLQGIGAHASIRSTYSTWQNRGLSIPGYRPITSYDVRISITATSVQIGTIYWPQVSIGAQFSNSLLIILGLDLYL